MNEIKGLVLYSIDYKEKSKIVYLYTPYGHDSVKANRSKEMNSGQMGFTMGLNEVAYIKSAGRLPALLEYRLEESFFDLSQSISKMAVVANMIEVIRRIPEDSSHEKIYAFIIICLKRLRTENPQKVLAVFLIKMLYVFGVAPNLKHCMVCGSEEVSVFSVAEGGAFCRIHRNSARTGGYALWKEYYYDKKDIALYSDTAFDEFLQDIFRYYAVHVQIFLK